jgi:hypothetical protein
VENVQEGEEVSLSFPQPTDEAVPWIERRARVVERHSETDCATLQLTEPLESVEPLRLGNSCSPGDSFWSFGYPYARGEFGVPMDGRVLLPEGRNNLGKPAVHLYSDTVAAG